MMDASILPYWFITGVVFFFGAAWGSFLNVCIHRIPIEQSVNNPRRSYCPSCNEMIAWYDNLPLASWLLLRAKCRKCHASISARYFVVELITALLFTATWMIYEADLRVLVYWVIIACLIAGTFIDLEHMIIPDRFTLGGIAFGLVVSPLIPSLHGEATALAGLKASAIGMVVGYGSLKLVAVLGKMAFKKDAMGMGDVKLMGALGALMGWPSVLFIIMVSSLLGTAVGVTLIMGAKKGWQSRIPYGPYIAAAAIIWILNGHKLWAMYMNLITGAY